MILSLNYAGLDCTVRYVTALNWIPAKNIMIIRREQRPMGPDETAITRAVSQHQPRLRRGSDYCGKLSQATREAKQKGCDGIAGR